MRRLLVLLPTLFLSVAYAADPENYRPAAVDVVHIKSFPPIGKWMIAPDLEPAHWLGALLGGKKFREPINLIIIDPIARSAEEAKPRFGGAAAKAGFRSRKGHSSGYWGWIGTGLQAQYPEEKSHALADEPYEFNNDHGRFFGPYGHEGRFFFIGSLSRERVAPLSEPEHLYVSFNSARDRFARALDEKTDYRLTTFVDLENAIIGSTELTTGDHDHMAAVLTARK